MEHRLIARLVLVAVAALVLAVGLLPLLVVGDLPDRLATQWSFAGEVTSTISTSAMRVGLAVALVPMAAALVAVAFTRRRARPGSRPMWVGTVAMVAAIAAGAAAHIVASNHGATDWRQVSGPSVGEIILVIGAGLAVGALAAWAAAGLPETAVAAVGAQPLEVADSSGVAWSRTLTMKWLWALATVMAAVGLGVALAGGDGWIGLVLVLSAVPAVLLARIEVFADRRGLTVTYGPSAWPRTHIPIDRIATAEAIDLRPHEWGGWGYRGSVKVFRRAAVVLRGGPGLRIELEDGRQFAVSIDDPGTAAAVLMREVRNR